MKHTAPHTHLHIYHASALEIPAHSRIFTQKNVDIAVILVSLAGLISAAAFLITMP